MDQVLELSELMVSMQLLDNVLGHGLRIAPDGLEQGQCVQMEPAFQGKLAKEEL